MTMPESAIEMEQRAERAVRRGELLVALELFEQLVTMLPDDDRLQRRIESVRAIPAPRPARIAVALAQGCARQLRADRRAAHPASAQGSGEDARSASRPGARGTTVSGAAALDRSMVRRYSGMAVVPLPRD